MPRAKLLPVETQSIHATVYSLLADCDRAKNSSMPWNFSPRYSILRETIGRRCSSTQVMSPVRPMPPMVAANHAGFSMGLHTKRVPSDRTSSKRET